MCFVISCMCFEQVISVIWNCLAYSNSCVNPFVYNHTSKDFRDSFRSVVLSSCRHHRATNVTTDGAGSFVTVASHRRPRVKHQSVEHPQHPPSLDCDESIVERKVLVASLGGTDVVAESHQLFSLEPIPVVNYVAADSSSDNVAELAEVFSDIPVLQERASEGERINLYDAPVPQCRAPRGYSCLVPVKAVSENWSSVTVKAETSVEFRTSVALSMSQ